MKKSNGMWSAVSAAVLLLGGCGVESSGDGAGAFGEVTVDIVGTPAGFTCGVAYKNGSPVVDGACQGAHTLSGTPAFNFHIVSEGDFGLSSGNGFFSQALSFSSGDVSQPDFLELPKGTACGFKHTCNSRNETCLGNDPATSCPIGWMRRSGSDINASSGCNYVWCEYQDPHNLCTTATCEITNAPLGLACGISDNDMGTLQQGQCLGGLTVNGCPLGYTRHGFFDSGRSSGHGIGWCSRGS